MSSGFNIQEALNNALTNAKSSFDELQMYFGDDYVINNKITLHQPTVGDVIKLGEKDYYGMIHSLTAIPTDLIAQLDELGICWMDISDFELFIMLTRGIPHEISSIIFGDNIDFSLFTPCINPQNDMLVLKDLVHDITIDLHIYSKIVTYIRAMHNIVPKPKKAFNSATKEFMIEMAHEELANSKKQEYKSMMRPMISAMINSAGFKYNLEEIRKMPIVAFMDSVQRIQVISHANNLTLGAYMGNIDVSKIKKDEFDWLRDLAK